MMTSELEEFMTETQKFFDDQTPQRFVEDFFRVDTPSQVIYLDYISRQPKLRRDEIEKLIKDYVPTPRY